jgi:hypothetical protein
MLKEESERLVCTSRDLLYLFLALLIARVRGIQGGTHHADLRCIIVCFSICAHESRP